MHAENLVVNDGSERQVVEHLSAVAPHIDGAVLTQALVIESVHLRDLARLVVAPDKSDALWIADLQSKEQKECLYRVVPSVDEVSHEEIVGVGALASDLEQLHQVIELTVDITTDLS